MHKPEEHEYAPYHQQYVSLVGEDDVLAVLSSQAEELRRLLSGVSEEKGDFAYSEGKWTLKQQLGHVIDAERIFGYRAFRISRGDETPLAGFDQDLYITRGGHNEIETADLIEEFDLTRRANLAFFKKLGSSEFERMGTASNTMVSVRALAFIMAGHARHHFGILREHYLA